jgi:hypothetical protein
MQQHDDIIHRTVAAACFCVRHRMIGNIIVVSADGEISVVAEQDGL